MKQQKRLIQLKERSLNGSCVLNLKRYSRFLKNIKNIKRKLSLKYIVKPAVLVWLYKDGSSVHERHKNWRFRTVYILLREVIKLYFQVQLTKLR